jgi:hypothetical protein
VSKYLLGNRWRDLGELPKVADEAFLEQARHPRELPLDDSDGSPTILRHIPSSVAASRNAWSASRRRPR